MDDTLACVLTKINNAKVETVPFEHFVIYEFLPSVVYNKLINANSKLTLDNIQKIEIAGKGFKNPTAENVNEAGTITYNLSNASNIHQEIYNLFANIKIKEAILKKYNYNTTNIDTIKNSPELLRDKINRFIMFKEFTNWN